jgi:hypothetical protein
MVTLSLFLALAQAAASTTPAATTSRTLRPLEDYTAFSLEGGQLKLGVLAFEYGITDWLSIGTDPPAWAARLVGPILVPNAHAELALVRQERGRLSAMAAGYYLRLSRVSGADGGVVAVPLSLFASAGVTPRNWVHLEGVFNFVRGFGTGDTDRADVEGAITTRSWQLGVMFEHRLLRQLALTLRGRLQVATSPLVLRGDADPDPFTHAEVQVELRPAREHPWAVVAAGTYQWKHAHLRLGVGYGSYFVPGANVVPPYFGIIPDGSFALYF